jgi:ArsR family transcriptional regulator
MEIKDATSALAALAHEGRLGIFRLLVAAGPAGLAAGEVGRRLDLAASTLSASLTLLAHAGLVQSRRDGRSIIYSARFDRMGELMSFLAEDCCAGAPEVCGPVAAVAQRAACRPVT